MQKAEVTGTPEAFRQHMLQNQPQELSPGQRPGLHLFGFAVLVTEGHQAIRGPVEEPPKVFVLSDVV